MIIIMIIFAILILWGLGTIIVVVLATIKTAINIAANRKQNRIK